MLPLGPTSATPKLPAETAWELVLADYRTTALSVGQHPLALLRSRVPAGTLSSRELAGCEDGERVAVAGLVVARQRPATARGVVFMLLEDEHGQVNLVVPPPVYDRYRAVIRGEPLVLARGRFELNGRNRNIVCAELASLAPLARDAAGASELRSSLPGAHSFGR